MPAPLAQPSAPLEADPKQVHAWLQSGEAILIDVREPDEHARERVTDARCEPLSRFDPERLRSLARPGQTIVLHCKGGKRSADACRLAAGLATQGHPVLSMTGGIEAWKQHGLPVHTNTLAPGFSVMRQTQLTIGAAVLAGSALAWLVHPAFLIVPAFFGSGLIFAGATGTCGLAALLARMPWNRSGAACSLVPQTASPQKATPSQEIPA